jgi:predicted DNA-binding ribbon-helix-helix protein
MGSFMKLEARHLGATTVALDREFWEALEGHAKAMGMDWRQWADRTLNGKPDGMGRARWLRLEILKGASKQ